MATHSSILAWRIPRTKEPSGLLSMGSHRVGHNRSDLAAVTAAAATAFYSHISYLVTQMNSHTINKLLNQEKIIW